MKKIYLVLTQTDTVLSKMIKRVTKGAYNHISIALDSDLTEMYSFGRLFPYIFFIGGFVHEDINAGTFKRFKNTQAKVLSLDVTDEQYDLALKEILIFKNSDKRYKFNIWGIVKAWKNVDRECKYKFYCSQFVRRILVNSAIVGKNEFSGVIRPQNFERIEGLQCIYKGLLSNYTSFLAGQRATGDLVL